MKDFKVKGTHHQVGAPDVHAEPWAGPKRRPVPPAALAHTRNIRSALFAFVFAPIALTLMGWAFANVVVASAVGQPLSSTEGLITMLLSTLLLVLISFNSEESTYGMVVTTIWSVLIGALQFTELVPCPSFLAFEVTRADFSKLMLSSLYPVSVFFICAMTTISLSKPWALRDSIDDEEPSSAPSGTLPPRQDLPSLHSARGTINEANRTLAHLRLSRTFALTGSIGMSIVASCIFVAITPSDTSPIITKGLSGVIDSAPYRPGLALVAGLIIGLIALGSRWSPLAPQGAAWLTMIIPFFFVLPLWASLTGNVVTPGPSLLTSLSLAAPLITVLGLVLCSTTLCVHWRRSPSTSPTRHASPNPPIPPAKVEPE